MNKVMERFRRAWGGGPNIENVAIYAVVSILLWIFWSLVANLGSRLLHGF